MRVLISGASRGLGLVVAQHHLEKGNEVICVGRTKPHLECEFIEIDFTSLPAAIYLPEPEVVIHCAGGGLGMRGPLIPAKSFYELFMTNLGGQAELNRFILPAMMHEKRGYICHVCSIASGEAVGSVGYNTVKSALAAYVRSLGREMAPYGVVVSGVSPGAFKSPLGAMERLEAKSPEAYQEFEEKRLPRGYMGKAEEILPLLNLLTSKEGSMMGGSVVACDAGEGRAYETH